jgi:hypothetical protein
MIIKTMKLGFKETQDLASLYGFLLAHFNVVKEGEERNGVERKREEKGASLQLEIKDASANIYKGGRRIEGMHNFSKRIVSLKTLIHMP